MTSLFSIPVSTRYIRMMGDRHRLWRYWLSRLESGYVHGCSRLAEINIQFSPWHPWTRRDCNGMKYTHCYTEALVNKHPVTSRKFNINQNQHRKNQQHHWTDLIDLSNQFEAKIWPSPNSRPETCTALLGRRERLEQLERLHACRREISMDWGSAVSGFLRRGSRICKRECFCMK